MCSTDINDKCTGVECEELDGYPGLVTGTCSFDEYDFGSQWRKSDSTDLCKVESRVG